MRPKRRDALADRGDRDGLRRPPHLAAAGDAPAVDFNRDIRPILSESCYQCHGPDHNKRKADLRLDTRDGLFRSADGSTVVVPGKPDESELLAPDHLRRPRDPHAAAQGGQAADARPDRPRQALDRAGGRVEGALGLSSRPSGPAVSADAPAADDPIDRFLRARLEAAGLEPSPEADRPTLIRRLSSRPDRTCPRRPRRSTRSSTTTAPTPTSSWSIGSWPRPIMASGWRIFWLDLVRFADTQGYHSDNHVDIWLFRDYVIRSFNANKPFDRFTIEQLAGDLLPQPTDETRIASGYNRLLQTTQEGGRQAKEYIAKYAADRVRNVSTVWMGATLGCAECHDHKYRPVHHPRVLQPGRLLRRREGDRRRRPGTDAVPDPRAGRRPRAARGTSRRAQGDQEPIARAEEGARRAGPPDRRTCARQIPSTLVSTSIPPRVMRVLPRGNWMDDSGPVVAPGRPGLACRRWASRTAARRGSTWRAGWSRGRQPAGRPRDGQPALEAGVRPGTGDDARRLRLAGHLADPPRAARLAGLRVRRQRLGRQGDAQADGDVRRLSPVVPASSRSTCSAIPATAGSPARTPSGSTPSWSATTPWRSAACSRDEIGGPSVKPYQPPGYWVFLNFPTREYHPDHGSNQYRRGLYTYWQRTFLHPEPAGLRRLDARGMRRPAPAVEHAAPGAGPAQRPDLRRGGARPGGPGDPRGGDRSVGPARPRLPPGPGATARVPTRPRSSRGSLSNITSGNTRTTPPRPATCWASAMPRRPPESTRPSWRPGPP